MLFILLLREQTANRVSKVYVQQNKRGVQHVMQMCQYLEMVYIYKLETKVH